MKTPKEIIEEIKTSLENVSKDVLYGYEFTESSATEDEYAAIMGLIDDLLNEVEVRFP